MSKSTWLVALAAGVAFVSVACGARLPPSAPHALLGHAVSFTLASNEGHVVTLPGRHGLTVVDYFAPSCVPCRKKVPALVAERKRLQAAGAELVLVGVLAGDEPTESAQAALTEWGLPGQRFLVDRDAIAVRAAGVDGLPMTQLFDANATLRWVAPEAAGPSQVVEAAQSLR